MGFIIGVLTVVMVLNCLLLILLVLIQLPKKEAGAGLAFGGGATDALFGAGSGNALTKITKYATVVFFVLAMSVGYLQSREHRKDLANMTERMSATGANSGVPAGKSGPAPGATAPESVTPPITTSTPVPAGTNELLPTPPAPPDAPKP